MTTPTRFPRRAGRRNFLCSAVPPGAFSVRKMMRPAIPVVDVSLHSVEDGEIECTVHVQVEKEMGAVGKLRV